MNPAPRSCLLVDLENLGNRALRVIKDELEHLGERSSLRTCLAFADFSQPRWAHMTGKLRKLGVKCETVTVLRSGKNSVDVALAVRAMRLLHSADDIELFSIVTGDSDFLPLYEELRSHGRTVRVVAARHSASGVLDRYCDELVLVGKKGGKLTEPAAVAPPAAAAPKAAAPQAPAPQPTVSLADQLTATFALISPAELAATMVRAAELAESKSPKVIQLVTLKEADCSGLKYVHVKAAVQALLDAGLLVPMDGSGPVSPNTRRACDLTTSDPEILRVALEAAAAGEAPESHGAQRPAATITDEAALLPVLEELLRLRVEKGKPAIYAGPLKSQLLERDPGFDEKTLGYSRFTSLLEEFANQGHLQTSSVPGFGLEVRLPETG